MTAKYILSLYAVQSSLDQIILKTRYAEASTIRIYIPLSLPKALKFVLQISSSIETSLL